MTEPVEPFRRADIEEHSHDWENCLHEFGEPQTGVIRETGEPVIVVKCNRCSLWVVERQP